MFKTKSIFVIGATLAISILTSCTENPIGSLKEDQPSLKYPESFWDKEQKSQTELWTKAVEICAKDEYKAKPNCRAIHDIQMWSHPKPFPKYGSGEGFGSDSVPHPKN